MIQNTPVTALVKAPAAAPVTEAEILTAASRMQLSDRSGAGLRLLQRLVDPQLGLDALTQQLAAEPALAIRVLRVANAPYYGQAGQVATLARATEVLGLDALRGIAAAACFDGVTAAARPAFGPDLPAFKRHSLASGVAAHALARRVAPALADQAFMAGLLHDLGLLLLWRLRPAALADAAPGPCDPGASAAGIGHAACGRLLMQAWALPPALGAAVAAHDDPHRDQHDGAAADLDNAEAEPDLASVLRVGHALAVDAGFVLGADAAPSQRAVPPAWQRAGAETAAELPATIERLAAAFVD